MGAEKSRAAVDKKTRQEREKEKEEMERMKLEKAVADGLAPKVTKIREANTSWGKKPSSQSVETKPAPVIANNTKPVVRGPSKNDGWDAPAVDPEKQRLREEREEAVAAAKAAEKAKAEKEAAEAKAAEEAKIKAEEEAKVAEEKAKAEAAAKTKKEEVDDWDASSDDEVVPSISVVPAFSEKESLKADAWDDSDNEIVVVPQKEEIEEDEDSDDSWEDINKWNIATSKKKNIPVQ